MRTGRKIIAVVMVKNGKSVVDLRDSNGYALVTLEGGCIAIVESRSQQFYEMGKVKQNDAERT